MCMCMSSEHTRTQKVAESGRCAIFSYCRTSEMTDTLSVPDASQNELVPRADSRIADSGKD